MKQSELLKEYKKKLGYKIGTNVLNSGKESFGISKYENGFVLKKRKQIIVLDRLDLMCLTDIFNAFEKKIKIIKELN